MSRSFRRTDSDAFAAKREAFADRKNARRDRVAAFEALGYDDAEALAAMPLHGADADRTREAFRNWR